MKYLKLETITLYVPQKKSPIILFSIFIFLTGILLGRLSKIDTGIGMGFTSKAFVMSEPSEASVMIDDHYVGKTPLEVRGQNESHVKVEIKKNGYQRYVQDFIFNTGGGYIEAYLRELASGTSAVAGKENPRMPPLPYFNQTHDPGPARPKKNP